MPVNLKNYKTNYLNLINEAKDNLLKKLPEITEQGGSLYPKERAEACWRDCFEFARISIYGTAAGETNITDEEGLEAVQELYSMLEVPVDALAICLKELQLKCREIYSESNRKEGHRTTRWMFQPSSREDEGQNINKFKPKIHKTKDKGVSLQNQALQQEK